MLPTCTKRVFLGLQQIALSNDHLESRLQIILARTELVGPMSHFLQLLLHNLSLVDRVVTAMMEMHAQRNLALECVALVHDIDQFSTLILCLSQQVIFQLPHPSCEAVDDDFVLKRSVRSSNACRNDWVRVDRFNFKL